MHVSPRRAALAGFVAGVPFWAAVVWVFAVIDEAQRSKQSQASLGGAR